MSRAQELRDNLARVLQRIDEARSVADALLDLFWDDEHGGVFTTGRDAEALVTRPKDLLDNATPSASSLAAVGLLRLGALTGVGRYEDRAHDILRLLGGPAARHPTALGHLLAAVDLSVTGITEVAVSGERPDLVAAVLEAYRPDVVLAWGEPFDSPLWEGRAETGADGRAYVCRGYACQAPTTDAAALRAQLDATF